MKTRLILPCFLVSCYPMYSQVSTAQYNGSGYIHLLLPDSRYSVGLQHEYRYFSMKADHPGHPGANNYYFHTFNLYGRIQPHKRVQILVNFPVHYYIQKAETGNRELASPGDISILIRYQVLRTPDSSQKTMQHSLLLGGGIKLPTGRYNISDENGFYDRQMQPGSGSWDVLLNAQYLVRWNKWGLNTNINAKITTQGADNYHYGHTFQTSMNAFYWGKSETISVMAAGGIIYEYGSKDYFLNQYQPSTGGHLLAANINADFYIKRFVLGIDFKLPLYAQLGRGQVIPGPQVTSQLAVNF